MKTFFSARKRRFIALALSCLIYLIPQSVLANWQSFGFIDIRITDNNTEASWLDEGLDPFRGSKKSGQVQLGQAILFSQWQFSDAFAIRGQTSIYDDGGDALGIGELYLKYRKSNTKRYRLEAKVGAFFPDISLENTRPGWTSRSPLTNAAINTWIGEEVRLTGSELKFTRLGRNTENAWNIGGSLSVFGNNDSAGSMLAWRGWAMHDRQVRLGERIRLAELPGVASPNGFPQQSPYYKPFLELDDKFGYTASLFARLDSQLKFQYFYYDNRADPLTLINGQYGWHTQFSHLGASWSISPSLKLFSQWLDGSSDMGSALNEQVAIDFNAWYLGISKSKGAFTWTARIDNFEVVDKDTMPFDVNNQKGDAITLAMRFEASDMLSLHAEYVDMDEYNEVKSLLLLNPDQNARLYQLAAQWRF